MKILYVEDELSKNIPKIKRLFQCYLPKEIIRDLDELEEDDSGYGADNGEVQGVVNRSPVVHVEYHYPTALQEVMKHHAEYDVFIIDRNLAEEEYSFEQLQNANDAFNEQLYDKYFTREGDYFLEYLLDKTEVMHHFYFLTANANDSLRNADEIQNHIDFGRFCRDNFIDKSDDDKIMLLKNRIATSETIKLRYNNRRYLAVLQTIDNELAERFFDVLLNAEKKNPEEIRKNLTTIRNVYEHILTAFAQANDAPPDCFNNKNANQIVQRAVVSWILGYDHQWKKYKYTFNTSSVIKNFLYDIQEIASDFGDHGRVSQSGFIPTSDTVLSLVHGLKDIIVWYGMEMRVVL